MSERPLLQLVREEPLGREAYEAEGGYEAARKAVRDLAPENVTDLVSDSGLRGRGGAGFPTGKKWAFVPMGDDAPPERPKIIIANADEMEPGTFKDRALLEGAPHLMIESMIVAGWALQASVGYIFLRWAYRTAARRLTRALAEAREAGLLGDDVLGTGWSFDVHLHVSAGRYMCGEETGLLNALQGGRATPRSKPPFPQASGLWGRPTVVNNVETLCCVPAIVTRGPEWFRSLGRGDACGTKLYGASGRVRRPGLWELPLGTPLGELIEEHAGGMQDGLRWRGVLPGGASTAFLTHEHADVPLDYDQVGEAGSRLGTGNVIVLDDRSCPIGMLHNLERFFAIESCGWCTPCREGLPWTARLLEALERGDGTGDDIARLRDLPKWMGMGRTFCALAPGAIAPLTSALKHFEEDFTRHVRGGCPYRGGIS